MTALPTGPFRTIVADPPWPLRWSGGGQTRVNGRGERHVNSRTHDRSLPYATMSVDAIAALPVAAAAHRDAHLYLWAPDRFVIDGSAARVALEWGFTPLRFVVWAKAGFGLGTFPRPQHELLLVARRGRLAFRIRDQGSVQRWKQPYHRTTHSVGKTHSAKPDGALELIERASPGPYLELFARRWRDGWVAWGDELPPAPDVPLWRSAS